MLAGRRYTYRENTVISGAGKMSSHLSKAFIWLYYIVLETWMKLAKVTFFFFKWWNHFLSWVTFGVKKKNQSTASLVSLYRVRASNSAYRN